VVRHIEVSMRRGWFVRRQEFLETLAQLLAHAALHSCWMPGRSATLGIEDEGRVVPERQRRREVDDRGGGLPHPALPIRHRDHPARRLAHEAPPWNLRPGEKKKTRLRASLRSPRLAASRTPIDRLGGPSVDSRAPN